MQKFQLQNREPVSFSSIRSSNDVGCLERCDVFGFNFVLNLNNYRSSVGQHFWGLFHYLHKSLQTVEAGYDQDNLLFFSGWTRVIYGLLWALFEFGSLEEDKFCKRTKIPHKLVIVTNSYTC